MKTGFLGVAIVCAGALAAACAADQTEAEPTARVEQSVSGAIKAGEDQFDHAMPTGNGRACATCHVEADHFTLKPAHVEARFQALPRDSSGNPIYSADPLFNSIDADDYANDFTRLRQGLARVTIQLHPDVSVDELPGARSIDLFRAVPSIENVAFTGPFLSDRRASTLQEQALGAALQHIQPTTPPNAQSLDFITAYELDQFSSKRVRKLAEELRTNPNAPRAERPLSADEEAGREAFNHRCSQCHGGPTLKDGVVTQFQSPTLAVSISRLNRANLPVYHFRFHGKGQNGEDVVMVSPDPGRALITGNPNPATDFEGFDVPSLYGIADTAPYFHDNSSQTLEDVMELYKVDFAFAKMIGIPDPAVQTPFTDEEVRTIILYMKTL